MADGYLAGQHPQSFSSQVSGLVWRRGCRVSPGSWVKCVPVGAQVLRAILVLLLFLTQELASGDGRGIIYYSALCQEPWGREEDKGQSFLFRALRSSQACKPTDLELMGHLPGLCTDKQNVHCVK